MIKEFKLPEGVSFTDEEKRGITALGGWMTEQFNEFAKSQKSEEDIVKGFKDKLRYGHIALPGREDAHSPPSTSKSQE